tara:strand:- start:232 stop:1401 length:1170 start_codon:yes stop_codon:yes gene_type:complete
MAFKMRSGNKSSFKDMGSSPAKETDGKSEIDLSGKLEVDDTSIGNDELSNTNIRARLTRDAANASAAANAKLQKDVDKLKSTSTDAEKETAARKARTESMNSMPWNKDVKEKLADKTKTATSKREQRANYKAAKENARKGDGKITKEERQSINRDRDKVRHETAAAKGTQSLSFNWKNAILGGQGLQAGFDIGSKAEKIQAKMDRQDANRASKKAAAATNAATKSQKKARKSVIDEDKDGMPDTIQAPKVAVKKQDPKNETSNSTVGPKNKPGAKNVVKKNKPVVVKKKALVDKDNDGMSDYVQAPKKAPKGKETVSSKNSGGVTPNVKKEVKKADAKKPVVTVKNKTTTKKGVLENQLDKNKNKTNTRVKGVLEKEITKEKIIGPRNK